MKYRELVLLIISITLSTVAATAQCGTWNDLPNKDYLEGQHSVYRGFMKSKNYAEAFEPWKEVYEAAPAADGRRDYHYTDGIKIYMDMYKNETDEAKKEEYKNTIIRLYDEAAVCYEKQVIKLAKCGDDQDCYNKRIGYLMGRKGYDMYYHLNSPYEENMKAFQKAVDMAGNDVEYIIFDPYGAITIYEYQNENIDKDAAREVYKLLNQIAEYNVANNEKYGEQYDQAIQAMNGRFTAVEGELFDCQYFIDKYKPDYTDNPDPQYAKEIYALLQSKDCDPENEFLVELKTTYEKWAAEENAKKRAEFEANNPAIIASKAYRAGNYNEAIDKYRVAISEATDNAKKAKYHFAISSILFRKLRRYNDARQEARKAAELNPNYGRPYMLIGDMYATTARSCGDAWNQRLAILAAVDKYSRAKSVDSSVTDEANKKIGRYRSSYPDKSEGFMRGVSAGQSQRVGCWIGESVSVRFN